jgi:methionyl-tRNA synthetase
VGNVVEALALTKKYGNDAFRYFVMREMVFGLDADFSEEALVARLNADLANDLGNFVSRASTLLANFEGGRLPEPGQPALYALARPSGLEEAWRKARAGVETAMDEFAFQRALTSLWEFVGALNRFVDVEQPWALARDAAKVRHLRTVLYELGQALHCLGIVLSPFVPDAARKIGTALGRTAEPRLSDADWGGLAPGTTVTRLSGLFPRVDAEKTAPAGTFGAASATGTSPTTDAAPLTKAEFARIDLRVAEVLAAEPVPKSKKLLKLTVSLGDERRTIVAGIAEHYAPADLVGKKVVVVANLEPAKLMGVQSNGMLLAGSAGTTLGILTLDRDLPPGAKVS